MSANVGKVIRVLSPMELVINLGSSHGVTENSRFVVFAPGDELKDPDTGESLGQLEIVKGKAEAKHIQEKMTTIRSIETKKTQQDRRREIPPSPFPSAISSLLAGPRYEIVTEDVLVSAPFDGAKTGDLVRVL